LLREPAHRWSRLEQVQLAMALGAPLCAPGETFHYSDTGYILLGEILEQASGLSLAAALRSLLSFERLGLHRTWLDAERTPCGFDDFSHNGLMFHRSLAGLDCWGHTGFWGVLAACIPARGLMLGATFNRSRQEGTYGPDELLEDFAVSLSSP
jgi:D-alanyl-D-alanine carboxypeptidase